MTQPAPRASQPESRRRGRPIRGAIAGLLFGLFLSLDLVIFGVVSLDADILAVLPLLGLAAGVALGLTAPLHRRTPPKLSSLPQPTTEGPASTADPIMEGDVTSGAGVK